MDRRGREKLLPDALKPLERSQRRAQSCCCCPTSEKPGHAGPGHNILQRWFPRVNTHALTVSDAGPLAGNKRGWWTVMGEDVFFFSFSFFLSNPCMQGGDNEGLSRELWKGWILWAAERRWTLSCVQCIYLWNHRTLFLCVSCLLCISCLQGLTS